MADEIVNPGSRDDGPPEEENLELVPPALLPGSFSPDALAPSPAVVSDGPDETDDGRYLPFNVIGIGASAGGVEAYIEIFDHLSSHTGAAYVIVSHLSTDQKSHLRAILARHTEMPVIEIETGTPVEPNRVYVVPPGFLVRLEHGVLYLQTPHPEKPERGIDTFFYSLAYDQKNRGVGLILSGMDSDGALGLRAIKGEGGITMVQAPETAQYPEMPRSSISADSVDIVAPPRELAAQLTALTRQFRETNVTILHDGRAPLDEEGYLGRILLLMRSVSGVDFRLYKPSTVRRRIGRRMLLHRIETLKEYFAFLQSNPAELRAAQEDALINVTRFFRDADVFDALKTLVLPRLFEDRDPAQQLRIWVAGCSTGEEVYSIAMCVLEYLTSNVIEPPIQIFGTDASDLSVQKARAGQYSETIVADVSQERLRRFFVKNDKGFQVAKRVRDLCIFARQNLCHDPPFSRMDIISCRNVLIYFGAELQRHLIRTFHYALRPDGFLLLGNSETIREFSDLFLLLARKHKIYFRNVNSLPSPLVDTSLPGMVFPHAVPPPPVPVTEAWSDPELERTVDRIVLARYAPAAVVVNDRMEILQSRGRTSPFLELPPGSASLDLVRMTRQGIAPQVAGAVRRAIQEERPVQVEGLQVGDGEVIRETTLEVLPIQGVNHRAKCYLVVFVPAKALPARDRASFEPVSPLSSEEKDRLISQQRHDLTSTKLYLESLLDERDAKNQELLSANEEIQSANEELQSTNEELETTKEELQSSNEELHTVNEELQNRNAVLKQASDDLVNLLNSVNLPVLMLNNDLSIRQFTPATQRVMNVRSTDIGRPFSELRVNLMVDDLAPLFAEVLETLGPREIEVQDKDGHWFLLRVRPYRTTDNKIEGLVVALVDIDQLRRGQQELRAARDFSRSIIQGVPLPLAVVDFDLRIRATNNAFCALSQTTNGDLERRSLQSVTSSLWGLDQLLRENLERLRDSHKVGESFEFEHATPDERVLCVRGCVLQPDQEQFLLVTFDDITSHFEAESLLKRDKERLATEVAVTTQALGRSQEELRALTASLFTSQEDERRRIARELHDDVTQRLAALDMDGDQVEANLGPNAAQAKEAVQRMRQRIAALSDDVRLMSHRLHPSMLEDLGLKVALSTLTEEFAEREKMIATFSSRNLPPNIPHAIATSLYRIAQEALRNVSKHAGQTHVRISLSGTRQGVRLQVADFGKGFDVTGRRVGLGLLSMYERAHQIGATFDVQSAQGEGTRVTIDVPLSESN